MPRRYFLLDVLFIDGSGVICRAYNQDGFTSSYEFRPLTVESKAAIKPNAENVMVVHGHQTNGGQYVDVGISQRFPSKAP